MSRSKWVQQLTLTVKLSLEALPRSCLTGSDYEYTGMIFRSCVPVLPVLFSRESGADLHASVLGIVETWLGACALTT